MPTVKYSSNNWSWGFELEVGDVDRRLAIPDKFGSWEYAETDVINKLPPNQYVACDPLGESPPFGGEINTQPTNSWQSQVTLISGLLSWLRQNKQNPTSSCISHNHIHVHIPGLISDVNALKRLTEYICNNQASALKHCHKFDEKKMTNRLGFTYLKWDCGRPMPLWMGVNIVNNATSFEDFIRLQCCGKDAKSMGRPFRYAINTYCLKHTKTIEFRLFRSSLNLVEISDCFRFVEQFLLAALNGGPTVDELVSSGGFKFPEFRYSFEEVDGWLKTKWGKERGKKQRRFIEI